MANHPQKAKKGADMNNHSKDLEHLDELIDTMRDAEKPRTLEEQVAYLKSKGINPSNTYQEWDDAPKEEE